MPIDCDTTCGDYALIDWMRFSQKERNFLLYCALNSAASQGNPELIGVYEVTVDADYVAPADASLIIWNVPTQTDDRYITFSGNPGQETQVLVLDANGFSVGDAFTTGGIFFLNDVAPYVVNVRVVDTGTGEIVRSDGTAAQYDVGTSGTTLPLNNANIVRSGTLTQSANVLLSGATRLYADTFSGPYWMKAVGLDGWTLTTATNARRFLVFQFGSIYRGGTQNMFFQGNPSATSYTILEDDAGLGLVLGTSLNTPIYIIPNRASTSVANFSSAGTLIATGETGGTRIAKLRTEKATMAAGTTGVIADTPIAATSRVLISPEFAPAGTLYYQISAGIGLTILSTNAADAGQVTWQRITI